MSQLLRAACEYADRGWAVLPLWYGTKQPMGQLAPHGKDDASADLVTVFKWFYRVPAPNVGINCNASGLVVIDVDPRNGGDDMLADAERSLGQLPPTVHSLSGGGGEHYLFRHPGGAFKGKLADGLDIKDHGYIVAPPSLHPSGHCYAWSVDGHPDDVEVAELPEKWLVAIRTRLSGVAQAGLNLEPDDDLRRVPAEHYAARLAGREVTTDGFICCPFHSGGQEANPSLKLDGTLWACHGCSPILGKRAMGGNIFDFAGLLWGYAIPLRGHDFSEVSDRLRREL